MSSYFDTRSAELRVFREQGLGPNHEPVRVWVQAWIHDITLRAEFDRGVVGEGSWAFPEDLRDAMYGAIVHGWLEAYPLDRPGYVVDYAEDEEGMELLRATIEALHDLFHEAARRGIAGMDNPLAVRGELQYRRRTRTSTLLDLEAQQSASTATTGAKSSESESSARTLRFSETTSLLAPPARGSRGEAG